MRLLYILLVVLLASCSSKPQVGVSELNINLKDAQTIIMDTNKIVSLETNDSSFAGCMNWTISILYGHEV